MLRKLLKYDLKWIYKVLVVFYILALVFSVMGRAFSMVANSAIFSFMTQISFGFAIGMMVASFINCIMRLWTRFIKNIYKDESYLTHTLPVEKKKIYASKVISAFITVFTTTLAIIICLCICYYSETNIELIKASLELAASTYQTTVINLLLLICAVIFFEIIFVVLIGYAGIILGYKSNHNKMLRTIVIGYAMYMLTQVLTLALVFAFGLFNANVMNLINTTESINIETIKLIMYAAIGLYAIYIAFFYIFGQKQLEKGVNVE